MKLKPRAALMLSSLFVAASTMACEGPQNRPARYVDVRFEHNGSDMTTEQLARLSEWVDGTKQFAMVESVSIVGLAEPTERSPRTLAEARAKRVWDAMAQFGVHADALDVHGRVYESDSAHSKSDEGGRRAEVTLSPGCPNHCCAND